jgi:hypothetical protein
VKRNCRLGRAMVRGVSATNKSMSGGRISRANKFVDKARAISNASRAEHARDRKVASAQKELRIREDAVASGRLSEHETAMQEAKLKREAKAAKSAMFLAQALAACELDTQSEGLVTGSQPEEVVLSIRPESATPAAVVLTIRPLRAPGTSELQAEAPQAEAPPRSSRKGEEGSDAPVRRHAQAPRIVRAAPSPRCSGPPSPSRIAALVRHPSATARARGAALGLPKSIASAEGLQCRNGATAAVLASAGRQEAAQPTGAMA